MFRQVCMIILIALSFETKAATAFTDSLHFIIHNEKVVTTGDANALQFDISLYRPNTNWNDNYFFLGDADFYFTFNTEAFQQASPVVLSEINEHIDAGTGSKRLVINADTWWASSSRRLRVKVTARTNITSAELEIPLKDTLFIARVQWKLAPGNRDPKIEWDMTATGALTLNNNPIIPTFVGGIDKYPEPGIFIDEESDTQVWACEGSDVLFFVNARSTGDNLSYKWQVSNGGDFKDLDTAVGQHTNTDFNFDYLVHGAGDTLVIRHAPGHTDHLKLQCVLTDPTLPAGEASRTTESKELLLRDSIRVFLSAATNAVEEGSTEIKMCPTTTGSKVRLNVWGPAYDERNEALDVYVEYYFVGKTGSLVSYTDTIRSLATTNNNPNVGMLYYKELEIKEEGTYYVTKASTSHCYDLPVTTPDYVLGGVKLDTLLCNATTYAKYDTLNAVYSTSPDTTVLAKYSIALDVDTNLMVGLSGDFAEVYNLYGSEKNPWLGEVQFRPAPYKDTIYHSKASGVDTVYYVKKIGDCPEVSMREIEINDNYYAQIKVFLEGPMQNNGEMRCFTIYSFPTNDEKSEYVSPYPDHLTVDINQFSTDPTTYQKILSEDKKWSDWIYVKIKEGPGRANIDSVSGLLRSDGIICDTLGNPYLKFRKLDKGKAYYIVIEHLNHLSVMTAVAHTFSTKSDDVRLIDLTNPNNVYSSGGDEPLKLVSSKYCLFAGDLNRDRVVSTSDIAVLKQAELDGSSYSCDINQDGVAALGTDRPIIKRNAGKVELFN